jgi:hypothetical protein
MSVRIPLSQVATGLRLFCSAGCFQQAAHFKRYHVLFFSPLPTLSER